MALVRRPIPDPADFDTIERTNDLIHTGYILPFGQRQYERFFVRYNRGLRTLPFELLRNEYLHIRVRAYPDVTVGMVDFQRTVITLVRDTYHVPVVVSGVLSVEPIQRDSNPLGFDVGLGGDSLVQIPFQNLNDVNVETIMSTLQERNYTGFEFDDLEWYLQYRLEDVVRAQMGGGCYLGFHQFRFPTGFRCTMPFFLYDGWSPSEKVSYGIRYSRQNPTALQRGLFYYDPPSDDLLQSMELCGYIALMYAIEHSNYRRGDKHDRLFAWEGDHQLLYRDVCDMFDLQPHIKPIEALCNGTMASWLEELAPDRELVVLDQRHMPLYRYQGSQYVDVYPFIQHPHDAIQWDEWDSYVVNRLYIYLDLDHWHYVPIFCFRLFFQPLYVPKETSTCRRPTRPMRPVLPCPRCNKLYRKQQFNEHVCLSSVCRFCQDEFKNQTALMVHLEIDKKPRTMNDKRHVNAQLARGGFQCHHCRQVIMNADCFEQHLLLCTGRGYDVCRNCHVMYARDCKVHHCPRIKCFRCGTLLNEPLVLDEERRDEFRRVYQDKALGDPTLLYYRQTHRCAIKRKNFKPWKGDVYAFDFECRLDQLVWNPEIFDSVPEKYRMSTAVHGHTVNMACGYKLRTQRQHGEEEDEGHVSEDTDDDFDKVSFFHERSLDGFWKTVCEKSENGNTLWFAHNLRGYDGPLLLDYFKCHNIIPISIALKGLKTMKIVVKHPTKKYKIVFQDSYLHLPRRLKDIPAMFGLHLSLQKDYFPYTFNNLANENYIGEVPDKSHFNYHLMSEKDKAVFDIWYAEKCEQPFYDLQDENLKYCLQDTLILKKGLEAYRDVCYQTTKLDALNTITIADFTFRMYLAQCIPPDTLYLLNTNQYDFAKRAFFGGRTDVRHFYYKEIPSFRERGISLQYVDITSLYPAVQYDELLPCGDPRTQRYTMDHQPTEFKLQSFFGFIRCDIRPTRFLFHPVICYKRDNRLVATMEPLTDIVITSIEFQKALAMGYQCSYVYRIDEYDSTPDLFAEFIRTWLKIKIISSEPPSPENRDEIIQGWARRYNIHLCSEEWKPNPSMRTLAKLVLNSLWGKFGQKEEMVKAEVLGNSERMMDYYDRKRSSCLVECGSVPFGDVALLKKYRERFRRPNKNIAVATFVAAHARLRLWEQLNKLGDRVYYHDTDSIIYMYDPDKPNIECGEYLGDWVSETKGMPITEFVALAPKTYAYKYVTGYDEDGHQQEKEVCKAKGFTFNAKHEFTLDNMKKILFSRDMHETMSIPQTRFEILRKGQYAMQTYEFSKTLKFDYRKGLVDKLDWCSYPFGSRAFLTEPEHGPYDWWAPSIAYDEDRSSENNIPDRLDWVIFDPSFEKDVDSAGSEDDDDGEDNDGND